MALSQRKAGKAWKRFANAQANRPMPTVGGYTRVVPTGKPTAGASGYTRAVPAGSTAAALAARGVQPLTVQQMPRQQRWEAVAARFINHGAVRGVELGAWKGVGTYGLLTQLPRLTLTTIDLWSAGAVYDGSKYCGFTQAEWCAIEAECRAAVAPFAARVEIRKSSTADTSGIPAGLDFVFVDADHSYDGCKADIDTWWPLVRPGGYICGHDYGKPSGSAYCKPGVTRAVNEFAAAAGLAIETDVDATWFVRKPGASGHDATIVTIMFGTEQRPLFDAHIASVKANAPAVELITIDPGDAPPLRSGLPRFSEVNHHKLKVWAQAVETHKGKNLILLDGDTIVTRDPSTMFDNSFDVCFTNRDDAKQCINAGVVFVRCSDKTAALFRHWCAYDLSIVEDPKLFAKAQKIIRGQNQASLGLLLTEGDLAGCDVKLAPCALWNCVNELWASFDPARCAILHVKNANGGCRFRDYVLARREGTSFDTRRHRAVIATWNTYCAPGYLRRS